MHDIQLALLSMGAFEPLKVITPRGWFLFPKRPEAMPGTPCHVAPAHEVKEITLLGFQVSPGKLTVDWMSGFQALGFWKATLLNQVPQSGGAPSKHLLYPTWIARNSVTGNVVLSRFRQFSSLISSSLKIRGFGGMRFCEATLIATFRHGSPFPFSWPAGKSYMHTWIGKSCPHAALWGCCHTTSCETGVIKGICPLMMSCFSLLED